MACTHLASFAKKSGGKGDAAADQPKAAVNAGGAKLSPKAGSKNADADNVNTEAAMQAVIAIMKCAHCS